MEFIAPQQQGRMEGNTPTLNAVTSVGAVSNTVVCIFRNIASFTHVILNFLRIIRVNKQRKRNVGQALAPEKFRSYPLESEIELQHLWSFKPDLSCEPLLSQFCLDHSSIYCFARSQLDTCSYTDGRRSCLTTRQCQKEEGSSSRLNHSTF